MLLLILVINKFWFIDFTLISAFLLLLRLFLFTVDHSDLGIVFRSLFQALKYLFFSFLMWLGVIEDDLTEVLIFVWLLECFHMATEPCMSHMQLEISISSLRNFANQLHIADRKIWERERALEFLCYREEKWGRGLENLRKWEKSQDFSGIWSSVSLRKFRKSSVLWVSKSVGKVLNDIKPSWSKNKSCSEFDPFSNEPKITKLFHRCTFSQKFKITN